MLSDVKCRNAKCPENKKQIKITDANGLYLLVLAAGGRYWRMDYRFGGKRKTMALGVYPDVGLRLARVRRDAARDVLDNGADPGKQRRDSLANDFRGIAAEYIEHERERLHPDTIDNLEALLRLHINDQIGEMTIDTIEAPDLLQMVRIIEARGTNETAHRAKALCSRVFRYAIATGRARRDPAQDLRGALKPVVVTHRAAITEPEKIGPMMRMIWGYQGTPTVIKALRITAYTFVRGKELRFACWSEIDWQAAEWRIPESRMKMKGRGGHIVPLSSQALAELRELHTFTGHRPMIFPSLRGKDRPISDNTLNAALRSMGINGDEQVAHGFRAMARTLLAENGWKPDIIEVQLAHAKKDRIAAAYDRARYLPERREMMQYWADYLDGLRSSVISGNF